MRRVARFGGLIGALLLVAACSSGAATSGPTGAGGGTEPTPVSTGGGGGANVSDPCTLLTQAEVTTVVGQQVGPGNSQSDPKTCHWQYPADGIPTIQVEITIESGNTLADLCEVPGSSDLGFVITQVSGIGDGACFTEAVGLGAGNNLTFEKGDQVFTVAAVLGATASTDQIEAADKALALAAIAHI